MVNMRSAATARNLQAVVLAFSKTCVRFSLAGCCSGVMHWRAAAAGASVRILASMSFASDTEKRGLFSAFFDVWRAAWAVYIEACVICLIQEALTLRAR